MSRQKTLFDAAVEEHRPSHRFLKEMEQIIPWSALREKLETAIPSKRLGRKPYDLILLLKMLLLKTWFGLSDWEVEFQIKDRFTFREFCNLNLGDKIPDSTCLEDFRHKLEDLNLLSELFAVIENHCKNKGILVQKGNMVDATFIKANCTPSKKDDRSDPDAEFGHKGFGYSTHLNVDSESKLITGLEVTSARVPDYQALGAVVGDECYADRGYDHPDAHKLLEEQGINNLIMKKKKPKKELSLFDRFRNKAISGVRQRVEHVFGVWDSLFKFMKTSYRGLNKVKCQIQTVAIAYNLKRMGFLLGGILGDRGILVSVCRL